MLYTKIQSWSFIGVGGKNNKVFLQYVGMVAILFNGTEPIEQTANTLSKEAQCENCSSGFREVI